MIEPSHGDDLTHPVPVVTVTKEGVPVPTDIKSAAVRYLLGQEASTVLLFLLVGFVCWLTREHMTVGAPAAEAKRIAAFKEITDDNNAVHEKVAVANNATAEKVATACAAAVEKLSAQNSAALEKMSDKNTANVDKLQNAIERMVDKIDRKKPE